jgi:phosphoglycolate phosphatase
MFDFDGTLADTLADLAAGGNFVLARLGLPPIPQQRYRYLVGQGAKWLVIEALGPEHAAQVPQGLTLFKQYQLDHGLDQTRPYPGIPEMLDGLIERGIKLAVLSNKPDPATQLAVRTVFGRFHFDAVAGQQEGGSLKPDPAQALVTAKRLKIAPEHWWYLGDSRVDMETARGAGFYAVGALWGFRDEAELRTAGARALIRDPREILGLIDATR